jgi:hypothetical protein
MKTKIPGHVRPGRGAAVLFLFYVRRSGGGSEHGWNVKQFVAWHSEECMGAIDWGDPGRSA